MAKTVPINILFIGRNVNLADTLGALIAENSPLLDSDVKSTSGAKAEEKGFRLDFHAVTNQRAALDRVRKEPPSMILLETSTKPNSRVRFLEMIRYRLPTAVIFAVGRLQPQNIKSFDGFLPTPIDPAGMLAKVHEICHISTNYRLQEGVVELNVATRVVITPNGRYRMTPKQCALLELLMTRHGEVVPRAEIMESIWDTTFLGDTRTLDVHIRWLRERIEADPSAPIYLVTVRGVGYCLDMSGKR